MKLKVDEYRPINNNNNNILQFLKIDIIIFIQLCLQTMVLF